jgi:hypothetical protein
MGLLKRRKALPPAAPKPDPDMGKVAHCVHAALALSPTELLLLRRYVRQARGEVPAESSLPSLPALP